jgi:two-component system sensor histidine kinase BarA
MNAIMGFAQMLKSTELNAQQADYVDVILESGNKLLDIISNLLNLSSLQLRKTDLHPIDCNLNQFIDNIWQRFRPLIVAKNLKPILEVEANLPFARLDSEKLERVLSYLLSNALKFTVKGSVCLKLKLIRPPGSREYLDIKVEDTGCGIQQDQLKLIFDAFEQADNSLTRSYPGMGLGLGISSKIVEVLEGDISASSVPGGGSCFSLKIPVDIY